MLAGNFAVSDGTSARGKSCFVCSTLSAHLAMPRYTRDCGKSSSCYAEGWAPSSPVSPPPPTNTYSGWSKRASRGYYNHGWNEDASRGSPSARGAPETWADAEVEIVDEQDRNQVRAATTEATDRKAADATGSSAGDAATDEEAVKRRLSELHRLLNSRKESLNATYRKNAEANDKAYDLNQKSVQTLDALAKEYVDFEVTVAYVTHEQEAGHTLHVATLEVAEELERSLKKQSHLQHDLDSSSDALTAATKDFTDSWAAHEATGVGLCNAFREVSNRRAAQTNSAWTQRRRCAATHIRSEATELQEDVAIHRERTRRITNEHARAEGHVNDDIGSLGKALQAAARATHRTARAMRPST